MKVVILAGGYGTRLQEDTENLIPKPMVTIGGKPILVHIIDLFANQGFTDFYIAAGWKQEVIREYFDANLDAIPKGTSITVIDTGVDTCTGGRLARLREHLWPEDLRGAGSTMPGGPGLPFIMTYGDGLADVNFRMLIDHHAKVSQLYNGLVTLTAVNPPSRFGRLQIEMTSGLCEIFLEKGQDPEGWINAGFYVIQPEALDLIPGDKCVWEKDILPALALQQRLGAYQHPGEFQMMDTWRDRQYLEGLWKDGEGRRDLPFWTRFQGNYDDQ